MMGDFNTQLLVSVMKDFIQFNGILNLIKGNTCFKGQGSRIDLILSNKRFLFKHSKSYLTGVTDHEHLIYSMLKSTFSSSRPKLVTYKDYKEFFREFQS